MEPITAVHHVSFTVQDLDASADWYRELFGMVTMLEEEHQGGRALVLVQPDTSVFVGLHAHAGTAAGRFAETRVGLDHVAFTVADRAALEKWSQRLEERGIEHSQVKDRPYGSIVTFRDPDNIQLEIYAPPAAAS